MIEVRVKLVPLPSGLTSTHWYPPGKESNAPNRVHRGYGGVCAWVCMCVYACVVLSSVPTDMFVPQVFTFSLLAQGPSFVLPATSSSALLSFSPPPPHPPPFLLFSFCPNCHDTFPSVISSIALGAAVTTAGNGRTLGPLRGQTETPALEILLLF